MMSRLVPLLMSLALLGGCATTIDGQTQDIAISTSPPGAQCGLYRDNFLIASVAATPATVNIQKTKDDLWVLCVKDGYQQAIFYNGSGLAAATFGNIIAGGSIGVIIDIATGSENKYDSPLYITMVPTAPGTRPGPTALPPYFSAIMTAGLPIVVPPVW